MPVRLDIYLDTERTYAEGFLYMDDGESFKYQTNNEQSYIRYQYSDGNITCEGLLPEGHKFPSAQNIRIVELNVYGLDRVPDRILTPSRKRAYTDFEYSPAKQTLSLRGLNFPIESPRNISKRRIAEIQFMQ